MNDEIQNPAEDDPTGWRGVQYNSPVISRDGKQAGVVREVLGSDAEDIFHGIRLELTGSRRHVMVAADDVTSLTRHELQLGLSAAELKALPTFHEAENYHLASVGWLRRHLLGQSVGWKQDSRSDEEAG